VKQADNAADPAGMASPRVELPRTTRLAENAAALGRSWAEACRHDLQREGRPVSGGWPGTLSEARARVWQMLVGATGTRSARVDITEAERELAVRTAYRSARDEWRRHSAPEDP
jgi:hypothetical protein